MKKQKQPSVGDMLTSPRGRKAMLKQKVRPKNLRRMLVKCGALCIKCWDSKNAKRSITTNRGVALARLPADKPTLCKKHYRELRRTSRESTKP